MADHYLRSIELLDEVEQHRKDLRVLHAGQHRSPADAKRIAQKYDAIRQSTALAKVHAQLAEVQALHDLRAVAEAGQPVAL